MRPFSALTAVCAALLTLACGGAPMGPGAVGVVTEPDPGDLNTIVGRWCCEDLTVGCYHFHADGVVVEEAVKRSPESRGTWRIEDGMIVTQFKEGGWVLSPKKYTGNVLIVDNPTVGNTLVFHRTPK